MPMTLICFNKNTLYADQLVMVGVGNSLLKRVVKTKIYKDPSQRFVFAHTGDIKSELDRQVVLMYITNKLSEFYENVKGRTAYKELDLSHIPVTDSGQYIIMTRDNLWLSDSEKKVDVKEVCPSNTYAIGSGAYIFQMGIALGLKPTDIFADLQDYSSTCSNTYDYVEQKSLYRFKQIK